MTQIDWKGKLSSRKFWALLAGLVVSLLVFFNVGENKTAQVISIITAFGSIITYILAEAEIDKTRASNKTEEVKVQEEESDD